MTTATIDNPTSPRNPNLRAYLAGGGATAALIAAAVVVFVGVAAFVGFNGMPFGAGDSSGATVNLAAGVPEAAATATASTADTVAADPATPSAGAIAEILASLPPGTASGIPGVTPGTPGFGGTGPTIPGVTPGTPGAPGTSGAPGALGNTVAGLENAASGLGLNLPLGGLTDGLTGPIDKTVNDAVNGVGGLLGDNKLGDKVTGTVKGVTDGLLGKGGLTDSLLK